MNRSLGLRWRAILLALGSLGVALVLMLFLRQGVERTQAFNLPVSDAKDKSTDTSSVGTAPPTTEGTRVEVSADTVEAPQIPPVTEEVSGQAGAADDESGLLPADYEAVLRMVDNLTLIEACSNPKGVDTELLTDLAEKAGRLINEHVREETIRRLEAGIFERMEDYDPDKPFQTPLQGKNREFLSYSIGEGEARRIVLSKEEYPHLYALRDSMDVLDVELRSRGKGRVH